MTPRSSTPTLRHERALLREGARWVGGMDEVGRGALAGPVSVGVVAVSAATRTAPAGVRDSKLLTPAARSALVPRLQRWAPAYAVGHASPGEIDRFGIIAALRLAGRRALTTLGVPVDVLILDGTHNWLAMPQEALFEDERPVPCYPPLDAEPRVTMMVKADRRCAAVAAASVLAKVERDTLMTALAGDHPAYAWHENKGYSAPAHLDALRELGPCALHRQSWNVKAWQEPDDALADGVVREESLERVELEFLVGDPR